MHSNCRVALLTLLFLVLAGTLTAQSAPIITGVESNPVGAGAAQCLDGNAFGATQGSSSVLLNGTAVASPSWVGDTRICFWRPSTTPVGAATSQVITTAGSSNVVNFTVVGPPTVSSISPSAAAPGGQITITGSNFGSTQGNGNVVYAIGTPPNNVTAWVTLTINGWSDTQIIATIPTTSTPGQYQMQVNAHALGSAYTTLTLISGPTIPSISPTSGAVNAQVTITGSGFGTTQGTSQVQIGTQP